VKEKKTCSAICRSFFVAQSFLHSTDYEIKA
jgi:hypothetical protein